MFALTREFPLLLQMILYRSPVCLLVLMVLPWGVGPVTPTDGPILLRLLLALLTLLR